MLIPAAASETSLGVLARYGIKLDCVGLYTAETAASRAMRISAMKIGWPEARATATRAINPQRVRGDQTEQIAPAPTPHHGGDAKAGDRRRHESETHEGHGQDTAHPIEVNGDSRDHAPLRDVEQRECGEELTKSTIQQHTRHLRHLGASAFVAHGISGRKMPGPCGNPRF